MNLTGPMAKTQVSECVYKAEREPISLKSDNDQKSNTKQISPVILTKTRCENILWKPIQKKNNKNNDV